MQREGIHHALVAGTIGRYCEGIRRHGNAGIVRHLLLILYSRIGKRLIGDLVELGAGTGVQGHILHTVRGVDIFQRLAVLCSLFIGCHTVFAAHDIASGVYMIMTLQYHINAQLLKNGAQSRPKRYNIGICHMACYRIHGLVEADHIPIGIRILRKGLLHKFLMLCNGQVGGIEHHKLYTAVGKGIITVSLPVLSIAGHIGHLEMLCIQGGVVAIVVVTHQCSQRDGMEVLILEEAAVLSLNLIQIRTVGSVIFVDLITQGEQEAVVSAIASDLTYRFRPAVHIGLQAAVVELWVAHCRKAEAVRAKCRRGIAVFLGGFVPRGNGVGIIRRCGQAAQVHVVHIISILGGLLHLGGIVLPAEMQYIGLGRGVIPCDPQAVFRFADVHSQAVYLQRIAGLLRGNREVADSQIDVGAGLPVLMELHRQCVGSIHQHGGIILRDILRHRRIHRGFTAIGHIGCITAFGLIESGHLYAIDIDDRRIIVGDLSQQPGRLRSIVHLKGRAEKVCGIVILSIAALQQHIGHQPAAQRHLLAPFGPKAAGIGFPSLSREIHLPGPAGRILLGTGIRVVV